jgi:hypothetical protein
VLVDVGFASFRTLVASVKAVPETIDDNPFETPGKTGDDVEGRGGEGEATTRMPYFTMICSMDLFTFVQLWIRFMTETSHDASNSRQKPRRRYRWIWCQKKDDREICDAERT